MIAIIGKPNAGKTTLINKLSKAGYSTLIVDEWFEQQYENPKSKCFNVLIIEFGFNIVKDKKISKEALKRLIKKDFNKLFKIEELIHPVLYNFLLNNHFDFIEIPIIEYSSINFTNLFNKIFKIKGIFNIFKSLRVDNLHKKIISHNYRNIRNVNAVDIPVKKSLKLNFF